MAILLEADKMDKQKIDVLIATKVWNPQPWIEGLSQLDTVNKVHVWPTQDDLTNVEALFVWKPLDAHVLNQLPNLKWISSLGAGVDHLVTDEQIPEHLPITRIVDPYLTRDMTNYVIMAIMMHQRSMLSLIKNQQEAQWDRIPYNDLKVGVLGLGELGGHCAQHLAQLGFETLGFSRTPKKISGVETFSGDQMANFLEHLDVLVNLLPVTPTTESILNARLFEQMKKGAYLINVARGNHLVEEDLLKALDKGQLSGATLDVFREEPLPQDNPLWQHPKVMITPHVASVTTPASALELLRTNINKLLEGQELLHLVDRSAGY